MPKARGFIIVIAVLVVLAAGTLAAIMSRPRGTPAPLFSLQDLNGKTVSLAGLKGHVVVLDFWATWCEPCIAEIPHFVDLQNEFAGKGVVIIGMSLDSLKPGEVAKFAKAHGMNYPIVMTDETVATAYGADDGVPITYVIDRNGNVVSHHQGLTPKEVFENDIRQAQAR